MEHTVVLQSHAPGPAPWLARCLESVAAWASARGYERRVEGDELFARVPPALRERLVERPMVMADLARLAWIGEVQAEGARAVWLDADVLVFAPAALELPDAPFALGAEVWVQREGARLRAYRRVHNALVVARPAEPVTAFLEWGSRRLVERYAGTPPPHLVGPRMLGALHNLFDFPLVGRVGSLSPHVLAELAARDGPALALLREQTDVSLAAANLCASLQPGGYEDVHLDEARMLQVVEVLLADGGARLEPC